MTLSPHFTTFTAAELANEVFPPIEHVVDPVLARGVTLLAGRPKRGKSWLALEIALSVASGDHACGAWPTAKGDVLYAALEDNKRRLQWRINRLRPGGERPDALSFALAAPRLDQNFADFVARWHAAARAPILLIVDTLNFIRPPRRDATYAADYADTAGLKKIAADFNLAILLVHHTRKAEAEDPLDAVSGTTGISAGVDAALVLRSAPDGSDLVLEGRGRDIADVNFELAFDATAFKWSIKGDGALAGLSRERRAIVEFLGMRGEATPKEIADCCGLSHDVVRQLVRKMADDGTIERRGGGSYGPKTPIHSVHSVHSASPATAAV